MSANTTPDEVEAAWGEYHPTEPRKPEHKGMGQWIWEALQGDFNGERTPGQIGFDMVVSLIPVVDTVCDIRDLCANIQEYKKDPTNKLTLFFIALTVIGFVPEIGTVVKGIVKLVFAYLRKYVRRADDLLVAGKLTKLTEYAVDAALPKICEYLRDSRWVKWATNNKVPDLFKFAAKQLNEFADKLNVGKLREGFDNGVKTINDLLNKLKPIVPQTIREKVVDLQKTVQEASGKIRGQLGQFVEPVRIVLRVTAKKLDDHYWIATTQTVNRGWIAPMTEGTAKKLIERTKPRYASEIGSRLAHGPLVPKKYRSAIDAQLVSFERKHPGKKLPSIPDKEIKNFSKVMHADLLPPGTRLYRLIDPTNGAGGPWWISEAEFKELMAFRPDPKAEWRKRFAVLPNWNQDGQFVEYTVPAEGLPVWRGPAASQEVKHTNYQLEGGHEQFYFSPVEDSFVGKPRIDPSNGQPIVSGRTGEPDTRITFTDQLGEKDLRKVRGTINDPNIKGPYETGWGFDTLPPIVTGKRGLPAPPKE
jgi:hypothetical protein